MQRSWLHQALDEHFAREKARLQGARVGVLLCLHQIDNMGATAPAGEERVRATWGFWRGSSVRGWVAVRDGLEGARLLNYAARTPAQLRQLLKQFPDSWLVQYGPNWEEVLALAHFAEVE